MKIAMIGYGKMGQLIKRIAEQRNHQVTTIDPHNDQAEHSEISEASLQGVDVCIDFTHPSVIMENIRSVVSLGKPLIVGTTGWYDSIDVVKSLVEQNKGSFLYAANFSLGMNVFFKLAENAARIMNNFPDFDVAGLEYHHNKKADSPSGTTRVLARILQENLDRKEKIVYDIVDRQIEANELHFASVRVGSIPGTHTVLFDSPADTIELSHIARNREGFATGAVTAAEWLQGKSGFYTISDFIEQIIGGSGNQGLPEPPHQFGGNQNEN